MVFVHCIIIVVITLTLTFSKPNYLWHSGVAIKLRIGRAQYVNVQIMTHQLIYIYHMISHVHLVASIFPYELWLLGNK